MLSFCYDFAFIFLLVHLQLKISIPIPHKSRLRKYKKPVTEEGKEAEMLDYYFKSMFVRRKGLKKITLRVFEENFLYLFSSYG